RGAEPRALQYGDGESRRAAGGGPGERGAAAGTSKARGRGGGGTVCSRRAGVGEEAGRGGEPWGTCVLGFGPPPLSTRKSPGAPGSGPSLYGAGGGRLPHPFREAW